LCVLRTHVVYCVSTLAAEQGRCAPMLVVEVLRTHIGVGARALRTRVDGRGAGYAH
jgi:hypothetical protein